MFAILVTSSFSVIAEPRLLPELTFPRIDGETETLSFPRERPLLLYSYSAVDAFPVFTAYDLDEYDSRILRGPVTREPRASAVPMRLHLPRRMGNDSIFDDQADLQMTGTDT